MSSVFFLNNQYQTTLTQQTNLMRKNVSIIDLHYEIYQIYEPSPQHFIQTFLVFAIRRLIRSVPSQNSKQDLYVDSDIGMKYLKVFQVQAHIINYKYFYLLDPTLIYIKHLLAKNLLTQ